MKTVPPNEPTGVLVHRQRPARRADDPAIEATAGVDPRRWLTLAVLCISLLIIVIDNTIVNVALPTLVRQLGASVSQLQWVVDAYTVVFAGLLLLAGALGDRFGRRRSLTFGLSVFAVGSAAAAFAGGVGQLIVARAVMGGAAAFIMPATLSILTNVFTEARERALAIGLWSGVVGIGVVLGPVAGGFLLDHFWWGSVFIVNVPIAVAAIVAGRMLVPESRDPDAQRVDWFGATLSVVGLVSLVSAIIEGPSRGWTNSLSLGLFALAAVALASFAVWENRVDAPMLDVRFFRNPRFSAASANITLMFFALFGFVFLSTQYLQFVLGYSPLSAGLRTLPFAGAMLTVAPFSSKLVERIGTKRAVVIGMLTFATGLVLASTMTTATGYPRLGFAMLLLGAGLGMSSAPATESIMGSLPRHRAGVGSALNDTAREVGGALGVAVVGSIVSSIYRSRLTDTLPRTVPAPIASAAHDSIGSALQAGNVLGADRLQFVTAAREAFVAAMSRASIVTAAVAVIGAVIAARYLPSRAAEALESAEAEVAPPTAHTPAHLVMADSIDCHVHLPHRIAACGTRDRASTAHRTVATSDRAGLR